MGRHSNIILVSEDGRIIDSVKRVDETISSVRNILPGGIYEMPPVQEKTPLTEFDIDCALNFDKPVKADKAIMAAVGGISPLTAREIVYSVFGITDVKNSDVNTNRAAALKLALIKLSENVRNGNFSPCLITDKTTGKIIEFSSVDIKQYEELAAVQRYESMNELVDAFYFKRDMHERMRQKSAGLIKLLTNQAERISKKISILENTLKDAQRLDEYKVNADLITANIYRLKEGMKSAELENYYNPRCETVKVSLDPSLSPSQNAQRYYKKYNKAKTALTEAAKQLKLSREELEYIESTLAMTENAESIADINEIRAELVQQGYITNRQTKQQKKKEKSKPMHFVSSDGFDIYVGRNNTQNDYLTLKLANSSDLWFHTKDIHGSHTVIKLGIDKEVPRSTVIEAAQLAAYYSQARESSQVPVDYTVIKNVKKPNGAKPGMVIYEGYNTVYVKPAILGDGDGQA